MINKKLKKNILKANPHTIIETLSVKFYETFI